jgi:DNA-binding LytR/AlgR family response regulator
MRCLIVDDDEMSRKLLATMCAQLEDIEIVSVCENAMQALPLLEKEEIDLIFLDVEMPEMTGLDMVKNVTRLPQIIFVTSKQEYAVEAFEHRVTDYIQKPVQFPRLVKAIDRAREVKGKRLTDDSNELYVRVDGKLVRLDLKEVLYIESIGDYVIFHTEKKEKFIVHSTLKNIDDKITNPKFLKVHRSFIVNLSKIIDIQETNLVIKDKVIPISRAHRPVLMNHIKTL